MAILMSMDISVRRVPPELWHRVRKATGVVGTPEKRLTIREIVLEAIEEWLAKRGI